jgi:broad specificity phosphatase PhoE
VQHFVAEAHRNGLERAALVTHAGVIKVIVGEARGLPAKKWMRLAFEYESVVCLELAAPAGKPC